jgi:hypothetical protein
MQAILFEPGRVVVEEINSAPLKCGLNCAAPAWLVGAPAADFEPNEQLFAPARDRSQSRIPR